MFLQEISLKEETPTIEEHPFNVSSIQTLRKKPLILRSNVTFFVGENGSGKTTLLEAIAGYFGMKKTGGSKNFVHTENETNPLKDNLIIPKRKVPKDAYFFRADTFALLEAELRNYGGIARDDPSMIYRYTNSSKKFSEMSHGQGFKTFFQNRIFPNGLYFFDEPESAMSQKNQIEFLFLIKQLEQAGCQMIIATHSPVLLAYPQAQIISFGEELEEITYEETESYQETKTFLENYERFRFELGKHE